MLKLDTNDLMTAKFPKQEISTEQRKRSRKEWFTAWKNKDKPYAANLNNYLENQNSFESNARTYPRNFPIAIKRAKDIYLEDTDGRIFLDCLAGAGSLALGHNHDRIQEAILECVQNENALLTLDITTPIKDKFVKTLMSVLPEALSKKAKIQFCSPSGADAIEAATKLVKIATGRGSIFCFSGGYHGMTHGALSMTSAKATKRPVQNLMKDVYFMPFPYNLRCPFGVGGKEAERISLYYIEQMLEDCHSGVDLPAAFLLEVVQGEGGTIPASDFWLQGIRKITEKYDIPLIIDEVQTGIGRTGNMFAFQQSGIVPDVVVISKAIGGSLPLSLVVYDEKLDKWKPGAHAGTFRGNQMAMATGTVVLDTIIKDNLLENVREVSSYFMTELKKMEQQYSFIGEVRGRGLMIGIEIINPEKAANRLWRTQPDATLAKHIQRECFVNGLIIETGGRASCVLRLLPPLTITIEEAKAIIKILKNILESVKKL